MKKLLAVKSKVAVVGGLVVAIVGGNFSFAAEDSALVTAVVAAFQDLLDTALSLALKLGPIGVGIVVAVASAVVVASLAAVAHSFFPLHGLTNSISYHVHPYNLLHINGQKF